MPFQGIFFFPHTLEEYIQNILLQALLPRPAQLEVMANADPLLWQAFILKWMDLGGGVMGEALGQ